MRSSSPQDGDRLHFEAFWRVQGASVLKINGFLMILKGPRRGPGVVVVVVVVVVVIVVEGRGAMRGPR